jgi:hypothetical protein
MPALRKALAIALLALPLASCSPQAYLQLDNQSGQDIEIGGPSVPGRPAPNGRVTGSLIMGASQVIRAGACTYSYNGLMTSRAEPRVDQPFLGAPTYIYHLRLEPDFSLRLFNLSREGSVEGEVLGTGWPARPDVKCPGEG